ncbi:uncharacterized protein LOC117326572 [Pecten maximus]|uniref:uncharacterized protein LOC117326572 n=1 Tax=Pecten maximus TaxID=6579 RepID=UPI001458F72A|nr:uncharacterized protein LOC117326572 [Pecten maximus]
MAQKDTTYSRIEGRHLRKNEQTTCRLHQKRPLDFYCRKCADLCCNECLSTCHKAHCVCDLDEIIPEKKRDIQNFIERTKKTDLVVVHDYITSTEKQLVDNASNFEKLASELETQTIKLKEELDFLSAQTLSIYSQMKEENTRLLQTYKQDLEIYEEKTKQQLLECDTLLREGTNLEIYYLGCKSHYDELLPFKPTLQTASFTANVNYLASLKQALGNISTGRNQSNSEQDERSTGEQDRCTWSTGEEDKRSTSPYSYAFRIRRETDGSDESIQHISVVKEFKSPRLISSICHTSDDQRWVSYFNSGSVAFLDRTGIVKEVLKHKVNIKDISVSPVTDALWTCHTQDKRIMELVSEKFESRFGTKKEPMCLCVTASNHVIVGMAKNVTKFTTKGKIVLTALAASTKKSLVCTPLRISECPVTQNVAVIDEDFREHGGEGKRNVVVMDTEFRELFRYRGEIPTSCQHSAESESLPFICYGIVFDRQGNLIIGDHNNKRILLLNGRGEFVRILHRDKYTTWAVSVSREDIVFGVFNRDRVRLLKY